MSAKFRAVDRSTPHMMPARVDDWLPDDDLARFVVDITDRLDTSAIEKSYDARGSKAYHPKLMVALLIYSYATGTFSSRKIEKRTYDSVPHRFICANQHPDHDTICRFRRRFWEEVTGLFLQVLLIAGEMGMAELGNIAIDGTKMNANASKHKALSWDRANQLEAQLTEEIEELLEQAEAIDKQEDEDGPEDLDIPEELERREKRLDRIREAKERIESRAKERHEDEMAEYEQKLEERKEYEEENGRKKPGRKPQEPEYEGPEDKDQANLTDPDSRIMFTSENGYQQAYNLQAVVDMESHLILTGHVSQKTNDKQELEPALAQIDELPDELGAPEKLAADNGYLSEDNVTACEDRDITPFIATGREEHNPGWKERLTGPEENPPGDEEGVEAMAYRLKTLEGKEFYGRRKGTVEPVFGAIKEAMGLRQLLVRGLEKVRREWTLVQLAWNVRRMFALQG
jgi:transposase